CDPRFLLSACNLSTCERDLDALAGSSIFERILHQVLEYPHELVTLAEHDQRTRWTRNRDLDRALVGQRLQAIGNLVYDDSNVDLLIGPQMLPQLNTRKREQVIDQPRHAIGLHVHDVEEALPCRGIVARWPLQRFDETRKRRERRAQLMA